MRPAGAARPAWRRRVSDSPLAPNGWHQTWLYQPTRIHPPRKQQNQAWLAGSLIPCPVSAFASARRTLRRASTSVLARRPAASSANSAVTGRTAARDKLRTATSKAALDVEAAGGVLTHLQTRRRATRPTPPDGQDSGDSGPASAVRECDAGHHRDASRPPHNPAIAGFGVSRSPRPLTAKPAMTSVPAVGPPIRVLVTRSRSWTDRDAVWAALDRIATRRYASLTVVHGAASRGADQHAAAWVEHQRRLGHPIQQEPHPANWAHDGRAAGMPWNPCMVAAGADLCLTFIDPCTTPPADCAVPTAATAPYTAPPPPTTPASPSST